MSCRVGSVPLLSGPTNAGNPPVSYEVSYNHPTIVDGWSSWSDYSASAPAGATQIRVRATVEIGADSYIDPGYGEGPCTW